jgi:hypothetical protein
LVQMLTELIHARHHHRRVDGPVDEVRHQRLVAFQKPSDIEPLVMRGLGQFQGVTDRLPGIGNARF